MRSFETVPMEVPFGVHSLEDVQYTQYPTNLFIVKLLTLSKSVKVPIR